MANSLVGLRRFLHWGPITAMGIIKCITLTTLYMNSMWWPPNESVSAFLNQAIFLLLSSAATFNYVMATLIGPGFLSLGWKPPKENDTEHLQYCKICEGYKAPRSHHCRKCNRCVKKMDHHCPWINNCVGWANHAYFTYFLGFSIIGSFHAAIVLLCSFIRGIHRYWYLTHGQRHLATVHFGLTSIIICIFALGLSIGVVIALGMLLFFQLKTIFSNQTGIEIWIVEKAQFRRNSNFGETELDPFIYPYDLGRINNIRQVLNTSCLPIGDGIEWPVRDGCDQYTLTREQIAQKTEKRARTKTFKCIRPATGAYFPIFSHNMRVSMSPPCTDEPRIKLIPDDIVKVTRFRKHWLFGERVVDGTKQNVDFSDSPASTQPRLGHIRGWFPRRCVVELIEPEQPTSNEQSLDEKNEKRSINGKSKFNNSINENDKKLK